MYRKYLILFHVLDYCYQQNSDDLDLPPLLGVMSPYLWSNRMPMDHTIYDEWYDRSKDVETSDEIKKAIVEMLESYEVKFHFDFSTTKKIINHISENEMNEIIEQIGD